MSLGVATMPESLLLVVITPVILANPTVPAHCVECPTQAQASHIPMIKLIIQYPAAAATFFDFDHYTRVHLAMAERLLGPHGYLGSAVNRCTGTVSGADPEFLCITELRFSSLEALREGLDKHGAELGADFANYTDSQPVATVCEPVS